MALYKQITATSYQRTDDDSIIFADPKNNDYKQFLIWIDQGNILDPLPIDKRLTNIHPGDFLHRFTPTEQIAVQTVALASPQIMLGLTMGMAIGFIDLKSALLDNWMNGLVAAGVITSDRKTEILTP